MSYYQYLLSPIRVGNIVLKNRMVSANALPHFLQGPESFPAEPLIDHVAGLARNGAAVVAFGDWFDPRQRSFFNPDGKRFPMFDRDDPSVENYLSQLADAVHFYGSKIALAVMHFGPHEYEVCDAPAIDDAPLDMTDIASMANKISQLFKGDHGPSMAMTEETMATMSDEIAARTAYYQHLGFDMVSIHMSYRLTMPAQFLSPLTNRRTDRYGGSLENRARFPLAICRRIKEVCGWEFPIEVQISGEDPVIARRPGGAAAGAAPAPGATIDDTVAFAKLAVGLVDILQVRAADADLSHPIGYNSVDGLPLTLRYAEAIKESGAKILVEPIGGFQDPAANDGYIASGKADLIGMARAFICDPEYFVKIQEGRGDDVVPCVRCNKCHVPSLTGPWSSICSVNPTMGMAHRMGRLVTPPRRKLRVAVIGGGPAGMEAAIVAVGRGHEVTLYEKRDHLGGQLRIADVHPAKWPLRRFKDYLVRQVYKSGVTVLLDTPATPELVRQGRFDAVLAAVGAAPSVPEIPGADAEFVRTPLSVYEDHTALGRRVVVVGGAETGTETGMYLAQTGHQVVVLTRQGRLASDATPIHYIEMVRHAWEQLEGFSYITSATTTKIALGRVTYRDASGDEKSIEADDIVVSGGMKPLYDEALEFYGAADRFFLIGDCAEVGSVQTSIRTAFGAASQL
jgi:2,4-dienoyl-CoA reductase-like NADH-dependent reductase (Old Yellow Enzyme family)/thioredoxin reductase